MSAHVYTGRIWKIPLTGFACAGLIKPAAFFASSCSLILLAAAAAAAMAAAGTGFLPPFAGLSVVRETGLRLRLELSVSFATGDLERRSNRERRGSAGAGSV